MSDTYRIEWTADGRDMAVEAPTKSEAVELYKELTDDTDGISVDVGFGTDTGGLFDAPITSAEDPFTITTPDPDSGVSPLRLGTFRVRKDD